MALDNIPTLGPGSLNSNLDKVLVYKNGGSEVAVSLLTLTNSALNLSGVYLDTVNGRVGIYNPSPSAMLSIGSIGKKGSLALHREIDGGAVATLSAEQGGFYLFGGASVLSMPNGYANCIAPGANAITTAMWGIKGSGSTSATTSLLVQNSSGSAALNVNDAGQVCVGGTNTFGYPFLVNGGVYFTSSARIDGNTTINSSFTVAGTGGTILTGGRTVVRDGNSFLVGGTPGFDIPDASAAIEIRTTTKGFLPPRMTTAQKNAIASPATGLQVHDTDLNRPCFYNGTSWITL